MRISVGKVKRGVICLALSIMFVLCSGSAIQTINTNVSDIRYLLLLFFALYFVFHKLSFRANSSGVAVIMCTLMVLLTYMGDMYSPVKAYTNFLCCIYVGYFLSQIVSLKTVARYFVKVMQFITCVAIVGYLLCNNTGLLSFLPQRLNINGEVYRVGYIFNYIERLSVRNCAVFWEPGLFSTYLTWAMLADMLIIHDGGTFRRMILFSIGVFTAHSSAGYLLWIACILVFFLNKSAMSRHSAIIKCLSSVTLFICLFLLLNLDSVIEFTGLSSNEYIAKLQTDRIASSARAFALVHNVEGFLQSPIWGNGFKTVNSLAQSFSDTSTSLYLLNVFGSLGGLYTLLWIWAIMKQKTIILNTKIVCLAIVLTVLNKEPHANLVFTWVILFLLLSNNDRVQGKSTNVQVA